MYRLQPITRLKYKSMFSLYIGFYFTILFTILLLLYTLFFSILFYFTYNEKKCFKFITKLGIRTGHYRIQFENYMQLFLLTHILTEIQSNILNIEQKKTLKHFKLN